MGSREKIGLSSFVLWVMHSAFFAASFVGVCLKLGGYVLYGFSWAWTLILLFMGGLGAPVFWKLSNEYTCFVDDSVFGKPHILESRWSLIGFWSYVILVCSAVCYFFISNF